LVIRCTEKLFRLLGESPQQPPDAPAGLLEWYCNLIWIDRRKCLLFTQADTLFSFFVPGVRKAEIVPVGRFFLVHLGTALEQEALPSDVFGHIDPSTTLLAKTNSRSVLGSMNDFALHCSRFAALRGLDAGSVRELNHRLRRIPMRALKYAYPIDCVQRLSRPNETDSYF
jgi:uncharacterized protein DUF6933